MVLLEFAMAPRGHEQSLSADVARIVDIIDRSGLPYQLTAMGTLLEGEWDEVMALLKACVDKVAETAPRVSVVVKIDHRPGHDEAITTKVEALEAHLRDT